MLEFTPNPDAPAWDFVAELDRRVWASHLVWSREVVMHPMPMTAEEKERRITENIARELKRVPGQSRQTVARQERERVEEGERGSTSQSELKTLWTRAARRARLIYANTSTGIIEHLDAEKEARFEWLMLEPDSEAPAQWFGGVGRLTTDEREFEEKPHPDGGGYTVRARPMSMTVPGDWDLFLMMAPICESFPPQNTRIETRGETIELTETGSKDTLKRLVIARDGRLMKLDSINAYDGKVLFTTQVQNWRTVDTVSLPAEIVHYMPRHGSPEKYNHKFQLRAAHLNEAVAADALPFPKGAQVEDRRGGAKRIVHYQIEDGQLLSDAAIERIIRKRLIAQWSKTLAIAAGAASVVAAARMLSKRHDRG